MFTQNRFFDYNSPMNNPLSCEIKLRSTKKKIEKIYDQLNSYRTNIDNENTYNIHAAETVSLLLKTYDLYKDKYPECEEALEFAVKTLKSGILNGLPYVSKLDKDFEIVGELIEYINEVKLDYHSNIYSPFQRNITFEEYFNKKDVKNNELYYLFSTNGIKKNTFDSHIIQNEVEILERMLDNYEIHGDNVTYKLQNVYFDLKEALLDPFMQIDVGFMIDSYVPNKKYYDPRRLKLTKEKERERRTKYRYDRSKEPGTLVIHANTILLDLALYLSYYEFDDVDVEITYINDDYELKRYVFRDGILIDSGFSSRKHKATELAYRISIPRMCGYTANMVSDLYKVIDENIGTLKIERMIPSSSRCFNKKFIDIFKEFDIIKYYVSYNYLMTEMPETFIYIIMRESSEKIGMPLDERFIKTIKNNSTKLFKNKIEKKKLFKNK